MDNEYAKALEIANAASRVFMEAQRAYRAREIGDAEFLTARAVYDESTKAFDDAFAKASA